MEEEYSGASSLLSRFTDREIRLLRVNFPGVELPWEAARCVNNWREKGREMKQPRHALRNWLVKAEV